MSSSAKPPKTPSCEKANAKSSDKASVLPTSVTPLCQSVVTSIPYSSSAIERSPILIDIGKEITPQIIGPMPANLFLRFLPCRNGFNSHFKRQKSRFEALIAQVANAPNEVSMYNPFIKAMKLFCPEMTGCDTSSKAIKTHSGHVIKPDLMFYHGISRKPQTADILSVEMIGEAKISPSDDPFNHVGKVFQTTNDAGVQTKGQVTNYAIAQLGSQFRTHAFSFLLFKDFIRLIRWDRAGAVVSERIELASPAVAKFFWRYNHAPAIARGVDTTVTRFEETEDLTKEYLFEQLRFRDSDNSLKVDDVTFWEVTIPNSDEIYIIGKPIFLGVSSLVSRATRTFKAWCVSTGVPVLLKDTWRICFGIQKPEHEIYEKLASANVSFIPTVLDSGDLPGQQTQTGEFCKRHWNRKKVKEWRVLQHYRLVLKEVGQSLTNFKTLPEALTAMANALQAHREAHAAKVLHRDISGGNILIYNNGGLLIDWEMARCFDDDPGPPNIVRTGTWAFQAYEIQEKRIEHKRYHDLESFYHVLMWLSLRHARHDMDPTKLAITLKEVFELSTEYDDGRSTASFGKEAHMKGTIIFDRAQFHKHNPPLAILLRTLSEHFRALYVTPEEPLPDSSKAAYLIYHANLEERQERLKFLTSDGKMTCAEDLFMNAARKSPGEWGDASYFRHPLPYHAPVETTKRTRSQMMSSNLFPGQPSDFSPIAEEEESCAGGLDDDDDDDIDQKEDENEGEGEAEDDRDFDEDVEDEDIDDSEIDVHNHEQEHLADASENIDDVGGEVEEGQDIEEDEEELKRGKRRCISR